MNISMTVINKITALMGKILYEHGTEIAEILQALGVKPGATNPPPPVPVPLPVPPPAEQLLPMGFNEAFYLHSYPDVANAVKLGYFASGGDHYLKHGKAEGRKFALDTPAPPPPPPPAPTPLWVPRAAYASSQALVADLKANNCSYMVAVDGRVVYDGDGFGPPLGYYMWRDGTVRTEDSGQIPLPLPPSPSDGEIINLNP